MASAKNGNDIVPVFSGKLSNDTLHMMDDDDLIYRIRNLMIQQESLSDTVEKDEVEMDFWKGMISCTTKTELENYILSHPVTPKPYNILSSDKTDILATYCTLITDVHATQFLENVSCHPMDDGGMLIKFLRPPKNPIYSARLLIIDPNDDNTYRVRFHNLPDTVPVTKFEDKYLKQQPKEGQEKNVGLKKFVTWLLQYVRPLYNRQHQICVYQATLPDSSVYHNEACTFLCFTLNVRMTVEEEHSKFEVVMEYDPCDILPSKVTFDHIGGSAATRELNEIMRELCLQLQDDVFPQVLAALLGSEKSGNSRNQHGITQDRDSDHDDEDDPSEVLFG